MTLRKLTRDEFDGLLNGSPSYPDAGWSAFYDYYSWITDALLKMSPDEMFGGAELSTKISYNMDRWYAVKFKIKQDKNGLMMWPLKLIPQEFRDKYPGVLGAYWVATMKDGKIIDAKPPLAKNLIELYLANKWLIEK